MTKEEWEVVTKSWNKLEALYKEDSYIDKLMWLVAGVFIGYVVTHFLMVLQ